MTEDFFGDGVLGDSLVIVNTETGLRTMSMYELFACDFEKQRIEVWNGERFDRVTSVRRFKTNKQIVRVLSTSSIVDCTCDFELLKSNRKFVRSADFAPKLTHLHQFDDAALLKRCEDSSEENECKEAFEIGAFLAHGRCCDLSAESGREWTIEHKDEKFLSKIKKGLQFPTVVCEPIPPSRKFRLCLQCDERPVVKQYLEIFYDKNGDLQVPSSIVNSKLDVVKKFWDGYTASKTRASHLTVLARGKKLAADLWLIARRLGYNVVVYDRLHFDESEKCGFELFCTFQQPRCKLGELSKVSEISAKGQTNLVYYVETETGLFCVGPGNQVCGKRK